MKIASRDAAESLSINAPDCEPEHARCREPEIEEVTAVEQQRREDRDHELDHERKRSDIGGELHIVNITRRCRVRNPIFEREARALVGQRVIVPAKPQALDGWLRWDLAHGFSAAQVASSSVGAACAA